MGKRRKGLAKTPSSKQRAESNGNRAGLGFEAQLFLAADKLRKNLEPSDYKHVALGLIFLRYISDSFESRHAALLADDPKAAEDPDEYLAENVFWVPKEARWSHLRGNAKQSTIGKLIDEAMQAIEAHNPSLKGVLPKDYSRQALDKVMLGELIDLISGIALHERGDKAKDILGRVYEYFLAGFAGSEGKRGGEFYTPRSVVRVLVEMLEPYKGRVYDPCCGSGGMFIQSEKFVAEHGGRIGDIAIYGQESNYTTWRLAKMNLAVQGIEADIRWNNEGSFHKDELRDRRFDYVLANPPFNDSDWGGERLREDARWVYGAPPVSNANFAWVQHFISHLAPDGTTAFVLAIMALASDDESEARIRRAIVEADLVECIVTLPDKLFYSTPIAVSIWVLSRSKLPGRLRDRRKRTLFIDASRLAVADSRTHNSLTEEDVLKIATTFRAWRSEEYETAYVDQPGFCREVDLQTIRSNGWSLFPAAYIAPRELRVSAGAKAALLPSLAEQLEADFGEALARRIEIAKAVKKRVKDGGAVFSGAQERFRLSDFLTQSDERLGDREEPEILTCTEGAGLVLQRERFSKRVATEDTSEYKVVHYTDIVYNPYLLWSGAIDQCTVVRFGITSPAYAVFKVEEGYDPFLIGRALKSPRMIHRYDGISVGTVKRRRRAPPEKFLDLEISLPPVREQLRFAEISRQLFADVTSSRDTARAVEAFFRDVALHYSK
jgi:type I restriction enzyme M protein